MELALDLTADFKGFALDVQAELSLAGVTALFGPSGAGKSTVLSAIAGFRPGLGRITAEGQIWQDGSQMVPAHRRPVGMVFQDGRLFGHKSVSGNLDYAARRADRTGPALDLDSVIEALDLGPLLAQRASQLSGGERQRVAIGRALLTRPRLMLMDEPLAALDRARKAQLLPLIAELPERFGIPVIYVSHQLDEIVQIADSMVAMHGGRVTGTGPVSSMIAKLDPVLTGRFEAGSVLEGQVVALDPQFQMLAVQIGSARLWMPDTGGAALGVEVRVRIRARDVSIAKGPVEGLSIRNRLPGRITGIEADEGPFAEVTMDCGGQVLKARISRMALADLGLAEGAEISALIKSVAFDRRFTRSEQ
ncbi:MAG: molybdenum ABC transporter ATP-binding protein [Paracoccaceae bacterium]